MNENHVVIGLPSFFPFTKGGSEMSVLHIAKFLKNHGYTVTIVFPAIDQNISEYKYEGLLVSPVTSAPHTKKELYGLDAPGNLNAFKKLLIDLKGNIFHLNTLSPLLNSNHLQVAKDLGYKTIFTPRLANNFCINNGSLYLMQNRECNAKVKVKRCLNCNLKSINYKNRFHRYIISNFLSFINSRVLYNWISPYYNIANAKKRELLLIRKYSDLNIAISPWVEQAFHQNGIFKTKLILQGIPLPKIPSNGKHTLTKQVITYVGRISKEKGLHLLISALEKSKCKNIQLNVVAFRPEKEKEYFQELKERSNNLNIEWIFDPKTDEKFELIAKSSWVCLPTVIREVAPRVVLEAFACKTPVICSNNIKDLVINNFNGLVFNTSIQDSLMRVILKISNNPELSSELSENIQEVREVSQVGREHLNAYRNL